MIGMQPLCSSVLHNMHFCVTVTEVW